MIDIEKLRKLRDDHHAEQDRVRKQDKLLAEQKEAMRISDEAGKYLKDLVARAEIAAASGASHINVMKVHATESNQQISHYCEPDPTKLKGVAKFVYEAVSKMGFGVELYQEHYTKYDGYMGEYDHYYNLFIRATW